jgi:hypothetical protein
MTYRRASQTERNGTPFCQATGCFEEASVYVVVRETEEPNFYTEFRVGDGRVTNTDAPVDSESENLIHEFDGFKLILYFCPRHDQELKYLIKGSELMIAKRCHLILQKTGSR